MSQGLAIDIKEIVLSSGSFGPQEIKFMSDAIAEDGLQLSVLRDSVSELEDQGELTPASAVRLGVCYYVLGRYDAAIETLRKADGGALAHYYLGKAHVARRHYDASLTSFEAAKTAGYNSDDCMLAIADVYRLKGDADEAIKMLDGLSGAIEQTAEYLYQRASTVAALNGQPSEVVALFERAVESDGNHSGALFGLALENDRRGNDTDALELYQRASDRYPAHVGTLINLGVLYEDMGQFQRASKCYSRVLDSHPSHDRARLFLKDAQASDDMYYDEEAQRKRDRLSQILCVPVSDFELSVRSRNCLQKMGIDTLGDLTRATEQELLASKNFGETSLVEIRDMLSSKGLELGQLSHERAEPEPPLDTSNLSPDEQALLERPISDLNLSVRARKCMVRLGINTISELVRRTGDELLECKNFGVTSLNEVREKLTQFGIKLRGD